MKALKIAAIAAGMLATAATGAYAACDDGEVVIKFSHVTNTDKHPKGLAASLPLVFPDLYKVFITL